MAPANPQPRMSSVNAELSAPGLSRRRRVAIWPLITLATIIAPVGSLTPIRHPTGPDETNVLGDSI